MSVCALGTCYVLESAAQRGVTLSHGLLALLAVRSVADLELADVS